MAEFSNSSARVMQADRTALLGLGMPAKTQDQGKFNFCGDVIEETKIGITKILNKVFSNLKNIKYFVGVV